MKIIEQIKQVKRSVKLAIVAAGIGIGLISALPATEVLHVFSTNEFCASCHTMKPMAETFSQSIHGGNNQHGFVADCIDCHPPKSNIVEELWVKEHPELAIYGESLCWVWNRLIMMNSTLNVVSMFMTQAASIATEAWKSALKVQTKTHPHQTFLTTLRLTTKLTIHLGSVRAATTISPTLT